MPPNASVSERLKLVLVVPLLVLLLPILLSVLLFSWLYSAFLYLLIWTLWLPKGKDVLFVYSDSPIWRDYMVTQVLPLVEQRAVVLNWSERSRWSRWAFAAHVFYWLGGSRDFNPLVAVFPPLRRAKQFRFWSAFKDWKRGKKDTLERMVRELAESLGRTAQDSGECQ